MSGISHKCHSLKGARNTVPGLGGAQVPTVITPSETVSGVHNSMNFDSDRLGFETELSFIINVTLGSFLNLLKPQFPIYKMGIIYTSQNNIKPFA